MRSIRPSVAILGSLCLAITALPTLLASGCASKSGPPTAPPQAAACQLSTTTLDFGLLAFGLSDTLSFTLTNTASDSLKGNLVSACADFSVLGSGDVALGGGESRTVAVRYSPSGTGSSTCALQSGTICGAVTLRGQGRAAQSEVSPAQLDFGRNYPEDRIAFRLTNSGSGTLAGAVSSPCPNFSIFGPASYSISPGQDQLFQVSFTPSIPGPQTCVILTGAADSPAVTCTGFGQFCGVSPTSLYFGTAWHWTDQTFSITNTDSFALVGAVSENYGEIAIDPPTSYNLVPGASRQFTVRWTPQLPVTVGSHVYAIDTGLGTCADVTCTSNGDPVDAVLLAGCIFPIAGTSTDFGTIQVGQPATLPLGLINSCGGGGDPFTVNLVEFSGDLSVSPALFTGFASGDTRTSQITFTPSQVGVQYIRVQIVSGNPNYASGVRGQVVYRANVLP